MTIKAYMNPDFTWPKKLMFFGMAILGILISCFLIYGWNLMCHSGRRDDEARESGFERLLHLFYEMIISATSVMSFACAYVVLNHVYSLYRGNAGSEMMETFLFAWENWKDFILLLLICLSCVINTILDKLIIPLKGLAREQIASVRMLGMFYAIIVLLFLNVIGDESEYSPVMMYYLGLMVGRFVYFDASFRDFLTAMKNTFMKIPLLMLGLSVSGGLAFIGFALGYLLERNYYIVGIMYTHLFLLMAVFVFHHGLTIVKLLKKK